MTHVFGVPTRAVRGENFPVASVLCPARLRGAVLAIYHFARTADDLADEGASDMAQRLQDLRAFRQDLQAIAVGQPPSARWVEVFQPLRSSLLRHALPVWPLHDLLDAFEQDVRYTGHQLRFSNDAQLLDYCCRSANPVGRLLLHLYGVQDAVSIAQSDHICTALQLINFWQDLSEDIARKRWYPSVQTMHDHGLTDAQLQADAPDGPANAMVAGYCLTARRLMLQGAPLACRLSGRLGWELCLVVQGGLRVLDKIQAQNHATWRSRPQLGWWDVPVMLWRTWRMRSLRF